MDIAGGQLLLLDRQVCFALYRAQRAMERAYRPLLRVLGPGTTYPQYLVLLALWERDGLGVVGLGERLGLDSGTLSPLLRRLEERGLLERRRGLDDERRVEVSLSPRGRKLKKKALQIPPRLIDCANLRLAEANALRVRLNELTGALSRCCLSRTRPRRLARRRCRATSSSVTSSSATSSRASSSRAS